MCRFFELFGVHPIYFSLDVDLGVSFWQLSDSVSFWELSSFSFCLVYIPSCCYVTCRLKSSLCCLRSLLPYCINFTMYFSFYKLIFKVYVDFIRKLYLPFISTSVYLFLTLIYNDRTDGMFFMIHFRKSDLSLLGCTIEMFFFVSHGLYYIYNHLYFLRNTYKKEWRRESKKNFTF